MGPQRHAGGSLKQANKKHKGGRKRTTSMNYNFVSNASNKILSKKTRKLLAKQQRLHKTKMVSVAQKQTGQPLLCLVIPLSSGIDLTLVHAIISKGDSGAVKHELPSVKLSKNAYRTSYLYAADLKKPFCFVSAEYGDIFGCLDLARLADWVIFVLPGDISRIDMITYSELMSALFSQGLPPSVYVVMSNISDRKELLLMVQSKFLVDDGKIRILNSNSDAKSLLRFLSQSQKRLTFSAANSYLVTQNALKVGTAATRLRSGMLAEALDVIPVEGHEEEVYLCVEGLLRGWDLPLFDIAQSFIDNQRTGRPYVHITGWGDFPVRSVVWTDYESNRKPHRIAPRIFNWSDTSDPHEYLNAELPSAWDNPQPDDDGDNVELDELDEGQECMSIDEEEEATEVVDVPQGSDDESVYFDAIDEETESLKAVSFKDKPKILEFPVTKPRTMAEKIKAAKIELQFPDEVETPFDVPARERFTKYRGLPSFSKCTWPTENDLSLPCEYSKIFRFRNYFHNRRTLVRHTLRLLRELAKEVATEPTSVPSGSIASLTLGPVPKAVGTAIMNIHTDSSHPRPLTVWSLLPYEVCMSVLHLTVHKRQPHWQKLEAMMNNEGDKDEKFDPDPIMAKEPMLFQVGIRRFIASPIYSQASKVANTNSKMVRFLTLSSSPVVATLYAPVMYAPQTVLQFRIEPAEESSKMVVNGLVASGSVLSVDPTRAIVKRILLSGHPYKINKRSAVVRYMFHNPEDIEYFKPVQMHTTSGAVGHIKQSVGTHGLMKCLFDRQLIASDVVLMPLYKRVFPKMTFDPQVTPLITDVDPAGPVKVFQVSHSAKSILKIGSCQSPDEENLIV